ncbi:hypothetical protein [Oceaniovalibus sp. ACAM 378]|jgi:hypothetical protein|uniref:hypothetical protein n=1 Tax=Oceaniovalibus sp. ACAM 378 TaxID=2599923 RepID=UPI0011D8F0A6|nr:hypothetical protein [Oceaniovalibus sp. ACAM 378]TYB84072.1 hypothetical protein FQ320_22850 [Oceaniovalibus sp. ACAM 378]
MDPQDILLVLRNVMAADPGAGKTVTLPRGTLRDILKAALDGSFSDFWYLNRYPDVAAAIAEGLVPSALDHYAQSGIFEGRMPFPAPLDEESYLMQHKDVGAAIEGEAFADARDHFYSVGFGEGRAFRLETNSILDDKA